MSEVTPSTDRTKAVFLDRDGTVIENVGYLDDPERVALLPHAVEGMKKLADAGFALVIVSNQSGLARGYFTEAQLIAVYDRFFQLLTENKVPVAGSYFCPDHPDAVVDAYRRASHCRKPGPGMLFQAADELDIDLSASWMIGDSPVDVGAGRAAGVRTIQLGVPAGCPGCNRCGAHDDGPDFFAENLLEAATIVLEHA